MNNESYLNNEGTEIKISDGISVYNDSTDLKGYLYFSKDLRFYIEIQSFDLVIEKFNLDLNIWEEFKRR